VRPEQVAALVARHPEIARARVVVSREDDMDVMTVRLETAHEDVQGFADSVADLLKLRGRLERVAPGGLPRDGQVIEDQRRYDTAAAVSSAE